MFLPLSGRRVHSGGDGESRTHGLQVYDQALSHLSYIPIGPAGIAPERPSSGELLLTDAAYLKKEAITWKSLAEGVGLEPT